APVAIQSASLAARLIRISHLVVGQDGIAAADCQSACGLYTYSEERRWTTAAQAANLPHSFVAATVSTRCGGFAIRLLMPLGIPRRPIENRPQVANLPYMGSATHVAHGYCGR